MDKLIMFCPNCKEKTETTFNGLQSGLPLRDKITGKLAKDDNDNYILVAVKLYTCHKCGSTHSREID